MSNKTYTLLKDLPDAKAGTEIIINNGATHYYIPTVAPRLTMYRFTEAQLISNPEWFLKKEEQQPKEWEIVRFRTKDGGYATKDSPLWKCHSGQSAGIISYETCLEKFTIHDVKRLSDGEVFTIGKVYSYGKEGILTKFSISAIGEMLCDIDYGNGTSYSDAPLRAMDVIKKDKDVFQWNDELALEFLNAHRTSDQIITKFYWKKESVEAFKQSKSTPKEDKITVEIVSYSDIKASNQACLTFSKPVGKEKYEEVKKAIEQALNH